MLPAADETRQLRSLEEQLIRKFGDRLDKDTICAEVELASQELADAKVRTFLPVLVQRRVIEALRRKK